MSLDEERSLRTVLRLANRPNSERSWAVQAWYAEAFEREYGCTEAEWLGWLPAAIGDRAWARPVPGQAEVGLGSGRLDLAWSALQPRRIALVTLPRLRVGFRFDGVDEAVRQGFMRRFDLYMMRGGG